MSAQDLNDFLTNLGCGAAAIVALGLFGMACAGIVLGIRGAVRRTLQRKRWHP